MGGLHLRLKKNQHIISPDVGCPASKKPVQVPSVAWKHNFFNFRLREPPAAR
jgi:hypothetical protein